MKRLLLLQALVVILMIPSLACGPAALQVTPTPTKTPRRVQALPEQPTVTSIVIPVLPTPTPTPDVPPTDTPTPVPPTDTPTPVPPPTDTPLPPTDTPPPPPPPPTNTPAPPPPTEPPAAPPPTQPPANQGPEVVVEFPRGNEVSPGKKIKVVFVIRDSDGVNKVTWGVFMQNQSPLIGGNRSCDGVTECRFEIEEDAPPLPGTYLVGADASDSTGKTQRGVAEIYVH